MNIAIVFGLILFYNLFSKPSVMSSELKAVQQIRVFDNAQLINLVFDSISGYDPKEKSPKFNQGFLRFLCPNLMAVGREEIATAEIFFRKTLLLIMADKSNIAELDVSKVMSAKLLGKDFEIAAINSEEQVILPDRVTTWKWHVKAIKSGNKEIN